MNNNTKIIDLTSLANNDLKIIIVPRIRNGVFMVDDIVIHTAFSFYKVSKKSGHISTIQLLDKSKITAQDKFVVICGHGNLGDFTIQGRQVSEIADSLVKNGYTNQIVYITSCKAGAHPKNSSKNSKQYVDSNGEKISIAQALKVDLVQKANKTQSKIRVYTDATGSTVTCENPDSKELKVYVLGLCFCYSILEDVKAVYRHFTKKISENPLSNTYIEFLRQIIKWEKERYNHISQIKESIVKNYFTNENSDICISSTKVEFEPKIQEIDIPKIQ